MLLPKRIYGVYSLLLFISAYCTAYASPDIYNSDTLYLEDMFRSIVTLGESYARWSVPAAPYWLDVLMYFGIRFFVTDIYTCMALFSAFQSCILAFACCYVLVAVQYDYEISIHPEAACCASVLSLLIAKSLFPLLLFPVFHVFALAVTIMSCGALLRCVYTPASRISFAVLLAVGIAARASDGFYLLWFSIPASVVLVVLLWRRDLSLRNFLRLEAILGVSLAAGMLVNKLVSPLSLTAVSSALRWRKFVEAFTESLSLLATSVTADTYTLFLLLLGLAGLVLAAVRSRKGIFIALLAAAIGGCDFFGVTVSGFSTAHYFLPLVTLPALMGIPLFLQAVGRRKNLFAIQFFLFAACVGGALHAAAFIREPFYPPLTACLDKIAREKQFTTAVAPYWEARTNSMLSRTGLRVTPGAGRTFLPYKEISYSPFSSGRYQMVLVAPGAPDYFIYSEGTVTAINGEPEERTSCPDKNADITVLLYPGGARLATEVDYLLDGSKQGRELSIWESERKLSPSLTLLSAETRYRMGNHWVLLHFGESLASLKGKTFSVTMSGDAARGLGAWTAKHVSKEGAGFLDSMLRFFSWHSSIMATDENTVLAPGGGTYLFFEAPHRDSRSWSLFVIEHDGETIRLR